MDSEHGGREGSVGATVNEPILAAHALTVRFGGLLAVDSASFTIPADQIVALIGPNGAGKSTTLNAISGFQHLNSGRVVLNGVDITALPAHQRVGLGMARTFQDVEVFPHLTVLENVLVGMQGQLGESLWHLLRAPRRVSIERRRNIDRSLDILDQIGVINKRPNELARNLSYGQQKLLSLARLMATDARLLMFDEPGAGLPKTMVAQVGRLMERMVRDGKTVVLIDHNMRLVLDHARHVIVMHHGAVIAVGAPEEIRQNDEVLRVYLGVPLDRARSALGAGRGV